MAHTDLLLVVVSINNTINLHTYMVISRGYKYGAAQERGLKVTLTSQQPGSDASLLTLAR